MYVGSIFFFSITIVRIEAEALWEIHTKWRLMTKQFNRIYQGCFAPLIRNFVNAGFQNDRAWIAKKTEPRKPILSSKSSREDMCRLPTSFILNIQSYVKQEVDMPQIQKMCYTIQFSILMPCAKYQEAGLCGSREKCDRIFLWRRRRRKTKDSDPYMSPPLKRTGDTIIRWGFKF